MGWFGTLIGSSLGFVFGGPLGAIGGAALGHILIDRKDQMQERRRAQQHGQYSAYDRQAGYFVALFSILGKIAAADGSVTSEERRVVEKFMRDTNLSETQQSFAMQVFEESLHSSYTIEQLANQFSTLTAGMSTFHLNFVDLLVHVAAADGTIHPNEEKLIAAVARRLSISQDQLERLFRSHQAARHDHYQILGCTSASSDDEIRGAYRRMAAAYHPDRVIGKELPEEFVELAHQRFREIQAAYEAIKKERNIR